VTLMARFEVRKALTARYRADFERTPADFVTRVVFGFDVPMRSSLKGLGNSTTRGAAWRPGSTA
jgi:hypothetical protein